MQTVTDQLFRDDDGNFVPNPEASLRLQLGDFGTEAFAEKFSDLAQTIHIPSEILFKFLERSEAKVKKVKHGQGLARTTKPWARKRRRASTPPEQLLADHEEGFAQAEKRAAKKAMRDDCPYMASSSEAGTE
ncbi:hypothetical protein DL98DRAFT_16820 [Cadophora sp. DSE1049]|nr:hypothetical protein DL98DRAFT_16820 [Cadophora sp. DSE1049]